MYFSAEEVKLIRAAAAAMPLGGARDPGKAQLSSLTDYAASSTLEALVMDIEVRDRAAKISTPAARALCALVERICLSDEELRRLPHTADLRQRDLALRHKRAMALRYVNKLRTSGFPPADSRRRGQDTRPSRRG